MITQVAASVNSCKDTLNRKIQSLETKLVDRITDEMKNLQEYVDLNIAQVLARVESLEGKMEAMQQRQISVSEYDVETTIVAKGLSYQDNENIQEKAISLISTGLGLRDIPIVRAKRMRGYDGRPGVVKIQLESLEDKKRVLRNKKELKNTPNYRRVFLRTSMTHTERIMDMNMRTLLRKIPGCENMWLTGHGKLVETTASRQGQSSGNRADSGQSRMNSPNRY